MRFVVAILFALISFSAQAKPQVVTAINPVAVKKVKLLRSNPHRYTAIQFAGTNPWTEIDDEDIIPQRRHRSQLEKDIDLSEHVRFRLWLARQLALRKFVETHGNLV